MAFCLPRRRGAVPPTQLQAHSLCGNPLFALEQLCINWPATKTPAKGARTSSFITLQFPYIAQLAPAQLPLAKLDLFLSFVLSRAC
jgi:hypothetical protein